MNIQCIRATTHDLPKVLNIGKYYEYDMSRYCGHLAGWAFPESGSYESAYLIANLESYFKEPDHFPYLIRVDGELAGFVMVYKPSQHPQTDWRIGEFFVLAKFQHKGIGFAAAREIFSQFKGKWDVPVIPQNIGALHFWKKTLSKITHNAFTENLTTLHEPNPIEMIVLSFKSHV